MKKNQSRIEALQVQSAERNGLSKQSDKHLDVGVTLLSPSHARWQSKKLQRRIEEMKEVDWQRSDLDRHIAREQDIGRAPVCRDREAKALRVAAQIMRKAGEYDTRQTMVHDCGEDRGYLMTKEADDIARKGQEHEAILGRFGSSVERDTVDTHTAAVDTGLQRSGAAIKLAQRGKEDTVPANKTPSGGQYLTDVGLNVATREKVKQITAANPPAVDRGEMPLAPQIINGREQLLPENYPGAELVSQAQAQTHARMTRADSPDEIYSNVEDKGEAATAEAIEQATRQVLGPDVEVKAERIAAEGEKQGGTYKNSGMDMTDKGKAVTVPEHYVSMSTQIQDRYADSTHKTLKTCADRGHLLTQEVQELSEKGAAQQGNPHKFAMSLIDTGDCPGPDAHDLAKRAKRSDGALYGQCIDTGEVGVRLHLVEERARKEDTGERLSDASYKLAKKGRAAHAVAPSLGMAHEVERVFPAQKVKEPPCLEDFCAECPVSLACWSGSLDMSREKMCICPCCQKMVMTEGAPTAKSRSMQAAPQGDDEAYQESAEMWQGDDNHVKVDEPVNAVIHASEPQDDSNERDGFVSARLGLHCPARCAVLEESIVNRWQMAFYRQGTGACLMLIDPGPTQKQNRVYVRMCRDCVEAYEAKVGEAYKDTSPNECDEKETTVALLQAMLEVSKAP